MAETEEAIETPIRVMIVDDHEIVRRGIAEIVDRADDLEVVAEAGTVQDALRRAQLVSPDVIFNSPTGPGSTSWNPSVRQTLRSVRSF